MNITEKPYSTNNALLAFCLYLAGVPFADDKFPCSNKYDVETLLKFGLLQEDGVNEAEIEKAAKAAFNDRKRGIVEYGFKTVALLDEMCAAFDIQQRELAQSDRLFFEIIEDIMKGFQSGVSREETIVRLGCALLKARPMWNDLPFQYPPLVQIQNAGKVIDKRKPDGSGKVKFPGFRIFSVNVGKEIRKKLRL